VRTFGVVSLKEKGTRAPSVRVGVVVLFFPCHYPQRGDRLDSLVAVNALNEDDVRAFVGGGGLQSLMIAFPVRSPFLPYF
jgi:hypothetical protein